MTPHFSQCRRRLKPPSFKMDGTAGMMLENVLLRCNGLLKAQAATPLDPAFLVEYRRMLDDYDHWQRHMVAMSEYSVRCSSGCTACCNHWVEDVNSFEVMIIADHLKRYHNSKIARIMQQCGEDCDELLHLEDLTSEKIAECGDAFHELPDSVDLLLHVFYQMRRPCPLLSVDGSCMVYEVRPLTCRMYVSVSDPLRCDPDYINDDVIPTCMITPGARADRLLDMLHERYGGSDDTGLRSQLFRLLSGLPED